MGTRSIVDIKTRHASGQEWETITTIYRQFDGYPSGMGNDIKLAIDGKSIVNGYSDPDNQLNGGGCAAAFLVGHLKKGECGNVYIRKPGARDCGEEFIYELFIEPDQPVTIRVTDTYHGVLYNGALSEFDADAIESIDD